MINTNEVFLEIDATAKEEDDKADIDDEFEDWTYIFEKKRCTSAYIPATASYMYAML